MRNDKHQDPLFCNRCGEINNIITQDTMGGIMCEAKTECKTCGFTDYWAYGFYHSNQYLDELVQESESLGLYNSKGKIDE